MKTLNLILLLLLPHFAISQTISLPQMKVTIDYAKSLSDASFQQSGNVRCQQIFPMSSQSSDAPLSTSAADESNARKNLFLLCMKKRCDSLMIELETAQEQLMSLSDEDLTDFLKAAGKSPAEIQIALMRTPQPFKTCQTADQVVMVFESCRISAFVYSRCE